MAIAKKTAKNNAKNNDFQKATAFLNLEIGRKNEEGVYEFKRLQPGAPLKDSGTAMEKKILAAARKDPSMSFVIRGSVRFIDAEGNENDNWDF
jgi:hypothetical protein